MLTLQIFGPAFGLPDPSPFAMKGEMLLKLAGVDYRTEAGDVRKAPKGKFPVLIDGDTTVPDSTFIRFHLEDRHGIDFDKGLSARERGIAWSVEKMLEDSLYFAVMYERWAIDENFDRGPRTYFDVIPAPTAGPPGSVDGPQAGKSQYVGPGHVQALARRHLPPWPGAC